MSQIKFFRENISHSSFISVAKKLPGLLSNLPASSHDKPLNHGKQKRIAVFIASQGRTGARLLGEIFNRNSDIFYQYEPLRVFEKVNNLVYHRTTDKALKEKYSKKVVKFIEDLLTCNFKSSSVGYFLNINTFAGRERSRALTSPPFCDTNSRKCKDLKYLEVSEVCHTQYRFVVIKEQEFRLPHMSLSPLTKMATRNPDLSIRVVHLVRDPRAYLFSMNRFGWFSIHHPNPIQHPHTFVRERCKETLDNIEQMRKNRNVHYLVLRYEDLILNPHASLDKLEERTGIYVDSGVRDWFRAVLDGQENTGFTRYIGEHRKGANIMDAWRESVKMDFVQLVQEKCTDLMRLLGYTKVKDEITLRNLNVRLVSSSFIL